jgi:tRNA(Ile)-lysidine synthase
VHTAGVSIDDRVRAYCHRHGLLSPGAGVLALVSGGADSTCLMHQLAQWHDGPVHVLAIDHGFRTESADEARSVARAASALGLAAHVEHLDLASGAAAMERARDARLLAAERVREREGLDVIATGHTRTDHVETVLFRAARGTGRTGALGIAPRRGRLVRPLLGVSRDDTRAWCATRGIPVVDDPTNADARTARARVRHGLMPALEAVHPSAEAHVARLADLLADEAAVIDAAVTAAWARHACGTGLDCAGIATEPVAMRRLVVRRRLAVGGLAGDALGGDVIDDAVERAITGGPRRDIPGGLICVDRGVLVAEASGERTPHVQAPQVLDVPGAVRLGNVMVRAEGGVAGESDARHAWVRASGPLVARPPMDGDRIALTGGGHQSVARLLQAAGVPARHRRQVLVVAEGARVLWVAGHRASADALATPGEAAVLLEAVAA